MIHVPQCIDCIHLVESSIKEGHLKCKAFPNGVPETIQTNEYNHRKAYNGDHGLQYEKIK